MNRVQLMFVRGSEPLARAPVRLADGAAQWLTDAEGRIEADLAQGSHLFCVPDLTTGTWREQHVQIDGARLTIVNIAAPTLSGSFESATEANFLSQRLKEIGGRYRFDRVLGRGGMGIVFRAIDTILERPVAIKLLNEELRHNAEAQQVFLNEARSLAALEHPNLVAVHDVTTEADLVLMVTECIEGRTLEARIRERGPLSSDVVARLGVQLAEALHYLHEHSIIHRDVKPANLMVKSDGSLKVIDFGLARSLDVIANKGTRVRGTPAYMAPEQIRGTELDRRTDIYQFGVTLYELLTGRLPFRASAEPGYAHVHVDPEPITDHAPSLPAPFARLVHQCLAKAPSERPADAAELAHRLLLIQQDGLIATTGQMEALSEVSSTSLDFTSSAPALDFERPHAAQADDDPGDDFFGPDEQTVVSRAPVAPSRRAPMIAALLLLGLLGVAVVLFASRDHETLAAVQTDRDEIPPTQSPLAATALAATAPAEMPAAEMPAAEMPAAEMPATESPDEVAVDKGAADPSESENREPEPKIRAAAKPSRRPKRARARAARAPAPPEPAAEPSAEEPSAVEPVAEEPLAAVAAPEPSAAPSPAPEPSAAPSPAPSAAPEPAAARAAPRSPRAAPSPKRPASRPKRTKKRKAIKKIIPRAF